jgi:hypothetical protein
MIFERILSVLHMAFGCWIAAFILQRKELFDRTIKATLTIAGFL